MANRLVTNSFGSQQTNAAWFQTPDVFILFVITLGVWSLALWCVVSSPGNWNWFGAQLSAVKNATTFTAENQRTCGLVAVEI